MATPRNHSVRKAFTVLRSFHHPDEWLTSSELSRRANMPQASGYRFIQTLEEIGALVRAHGRYRPGMLLVSLSHNVAVGDVLKEAGEDILSDLASRLGVTAHLGMLEKGMVTYLTKMSTPDSFQTHTRPGSQLEPYCTGLGKVLLAALPPDELEEFLLEGDLIPLTSNTIVEPSRLLDQLSEVRRQGFAIDDRETRADMSCVAVPIYDSVSRTVAAISATEDAEKMTFSRQVELQSALLQASAALARKICPPAYCAA